MDPSRYGVPGSRSVSTEPTGFYRGVVKAVDGDTVTVQVPRLFGGAQIPDVPVAGPGLSVDDPVFVSFIEGRRGALLAFAAAGAAAVGDITSVTAGTNLNGGGTSGAVAVNLDPDITLTSVTADAFYGDLYGAIHILVKNVSGGSLTKGTPVYATGAVGASGAVEVEASLAGTGSTMPAMGLLDQDLDHNGQGDVVVSGVLQQIDTDTPGYSVGDELYVAVSGGLTTTRPSGSSELVQKIGKVIRVQQSTGEILVQGAGRTNDVPNGTLANDISGNALTATTAASAPASTLTGSTLASGVTTSSLTSVGTLTGLAVSGDANFDSGTLFVDVSANRVGINDTTPSYSLDVNGTARFTDQVYVQSILDVTNDLKVDTDTLFVDVSADRVGINDSTPSYSLDVNGDSRVYNGSFIVGTTTTDSKMYLYRQDTGTADHIRIYNGSTLIGTIGAEDSTWLRLNQEVAKNIYTPRLLRADGGFQAGNGSAATPAYSFQGDSNTGFYITGNNGVIWWSGNNNSGGYLWNSGIRTDNGSESTPAYSFTGDTDTGMYRSSADQLSLTAGGNASVVITSTSFSTDLGVGIYSWPGTGTGNDAEWVATGFGNYYLVRNSSLRAEKENIQDPGTELVASMIDQVEPKLWNRIHAPGVPEIGPIAEDMDAISPYLAAHGFDEDGNTFLTGFNKTGWMSLMTLAIKDLRSQVAALTTRLEALEAE